MNKKGNIAFIAILLALIILIIVAVNFATRDCSSNRECNKDQYCGADNECHSYPDKIIVRQNSYVWPAIILGLSLVVATFIYKKGRLPFLKS